MTAKATAPTSTYTALRRKSLRRSSSSCSTVEVSGSRAARDEAAAATAAFGLVFTRSRLLIAAPSGAAS